MTLHEKRDQLLDRLQECGRVAVAFSAGVDSTVVAKAAAIACGDAAVAVTADSPSLPIGELDEARELAAGIGIRHEVIRTDEFESPEYIANSGNRCFHCKDTLYSHIDAIRDRLGVDVIVNGANLDDRDDHRPGMQAAEQHGVRSPLIEAQFTKDDVRALAQAWKLPVWNKPASPCLSSRIAYGVEVTPQRVAMVDTAEQFLKQQLGLRELRVRLESGDLARIETPVTDLERLLAPKIRQAIVTELRQLGFRAVTLDLEGFRSGNLNTLLPIESLTMPRETKSVR